MVIPPVRNPYKKQRVQPPVRSSRTPQRSSPFVTTPQQPPAAVTPATNSTTASAGATSPSRVSGTGLVPMAIDFDSTGWAPVQPSGRSEDSSAAPTVPPSTPVPVRDPRSALVPVHMPGNAHCICPDCQQVQEELAFWRAADAAWEQQSAQQDTTNFGGTGVAGGASASASASAPASTAAFATAPPPPPAQSPAYRPSNVAGTPQRRSPSCAVVFNNFGVADAEVVSLKQSLVAAARHSGLIIRAASHSNGQLRSRVNPPTQAQAETIKERHRASGDDDLYEDAETDIHTIFSPVVNSCLQVPMSKIGCNGIMDGSFFCPFNEKSGGPTRTIALGIKANILFSPVGLLGGRISLYNKFGNLEFDHDGTYNPSYWTDMKETRNRRSPPGLFTSVEIGAVIPDFVVPHGAWQSHKDAFDHMNQYGPALGNEKNQVLLLSLKQIYVMCFERYMSSPLMAAARQADWKPLFLLKTCIVTASDRFGVNGYQVTTVDKHPKSYMLLAAFYKGKGDNVRIITLTDEANNFMVLADHNSRS